MDRLYIISDTKQSGDNFGFRLGLSSPMYKVVTSIEDARSIPYKVIFVNDDNHPLDSIEINDYFNQLGSINLKDFNYLNAYISSIVDDIRLTDNLFRSLNNESSTKQGIQQLTTRLTYRRLTTDYGFKYFIKRNQMGQFGVYPMSEFMTVITRLINGYNSRQFT